MDPSVALQGDFLKAGSARRVRRRSAPLCQKPCCTRVFDALDTVSRRMCEPGSSGPNIAPSPLNFSKHWFARPGVDWGRAMKALRVVLAISALSVPLPAHAALIGLTGGDYDPPPITDPGPFNFFDCGVQTDDARLAGS